MKKGILLLLILCLLTASALGEGTSDYIYTPWKRPVAAPPAYLLKTSLLETDLGTSLRDLIDCYEKDGLVYVLTATSLIVLNRDLSVQRVVTSCMENGTETPLSGCTGITVVADGSYYITQAESERILAFNAQDELVRILPRPEIPGFENVKYRPTRMVVDSAGRLLVVSKGMYEGIVELNADGTFSRFFGVNEVNFTFTQLIWRVLATKEQRARQQLWLPTDFTNLCIDADGFMYATIQTSDKESVKRLNSKGENILKVEEGVEYPSGDLWFNETGSGVPTGRSQFIAVDTNDYGVFICLDSTRNRVFAYNEDCRLLFVFGGKDDRKGYFRNPVDICFIGQNILVLDSLAQSLEVFAPTEYGKALMNAVRCQYLFDYDTAASYWEEALSYNQNLTLAYSGIGRALLRNGDYSGALTYLKQGDDRTYYSKAFEKVRNEFLQQWFVPGVIGIAILIVLSRASKAWSRRRRKEVQDQ